ncbi:MAG TPA: STAS domain-containing protein [Phycisphaerae bacterium]|jgi:anti-anti-sigma factor
MAFKLAVISKDSSGTVFAAAYGDATARDFPDANRLHFNLILGGDWASQHVVLDMDAVPFLDSSAIGWLIQSQKRFREGGGYLVLHSVQPHVKNILNLLKIERVVPMCRDASSALLVLRDQPAVDQPQVVA